jgi:hypothetical protein
MARARYLFMLFAGSAVCASGAALVHAQDDIFGAAREEHLRANRTQIEADAVACRKRDGEVGYRGLSLAPLCTIRHPDAGKICSSDADCTGECIIDLDLRKVSYKAFPPGTPAAGQCTALSPHLGCFVSVDGGRAGQAICAD